MKDSDTATRFVPTVIRELPADLVAVVGLTLAAAAAVFLPVVNETPVRVAGALLLVCVLPGYAFVSALFPARSQQLEQTGQAADGSEENTEGILPGRIRRRTGVTGVERIALALALSLAVVALLGIVLSLTPVGLGRIPTVGTICGFTLLMTGIAAVRRKQVPESRRLIVPVGSWLRAGRTRVSTGAPTQRGLTLAVMVSLLLAVGSLGYAVAVPPDGEQFTEISVLTETEQGELVADGYPETLVAGESEPLVAIVDNHEGEPTEYTLVVELHEVERDSEHRLFVTDRETIITQETTLDAGETWRLDHEITPSMVGTDQRLTYLLYIGEPPEEPTVETADRSVHLWVGVE